MMSRPRPRLPGVRRHLSLMSIRKQAFCPIPAHFSQPLAIADLILNAAGRSS